MPLKQWLKTAELRKILPERKTLRRTGDAKGASSAEETATRSLSRNAIAAIA